MLGSFLKYLIIMFVMAMIPSWIEAQGTQAEKNVSKKSDKEIVESLASGEFPEIDLGPQLQEIKSHIAEFSKELDDISDSKLKISVKERSVLPRVIKHYKSTIKTTERSLNLFDSRWDTYLQGQQAMIAEDEGLLTMVADLQEKRQSIKDSLQILKDRIVLLTNFYKAEKGMRGKDSLYSKMYKTAMEYSLLKTTAPQLEQLKAKEQLIFSDIQAGYASAKEAQESFPKLAGRMDKLEKKFIEISNTSKKIQEAAYKSFFDRIKDYLLGTAAAAVILMCITMIVNKIQSIKASYSNAKKMKEVLKKTEEDDFPVI